NTSIEVILEHLEYLIDQMGENHVGFGSDFDGALISHEIEDVRGLHLLIEAVKNWLDEQALQNYRIYSEKFLQSNTSR
ncbi:membrane dipeptidase, partial [Acinetobacter baumannii]